LLNPFLVVMKLLLFLSMLFAIAGQGLGLNIVLGGQLGNVTADQFIVVPAQLEGDCQSTCNPANSAIRACDDDDNCLCQFNDTVSLILHCEQCLFTSLIERNEPMPDPRVGSSPALSAYQAACVASVNVSIPAPDMALVLPSNWDGPADMILGPTMAGIAVASCGVLGLAALYIFSNI